MNWPPIEPIVEAHNTYMSTGADSATRLVAALLLNARSLIGNDDLFYVWCFSLPFEGFWVDAYLKHGGRADAGPPRLRVIDGGGRPC